MCGASARRHASKEMTDMLKRVSLALVLALCARLVAVLEWGDLDATFVFKGMPPAAKKIQPEKDPEYCGKHDLFEETLVVNKQNNGLANVVVYLLNTAKPKIHPD